MKQGVYIECDGCGVDSDQWPDLRGFRAYQVGELIDRAGKIGWTASSHFSEPDESGVRVTIREDWCPSCSAEKKLTYAP